MHIHQVLVEDVDGGYILAEYKTVVKTPDEEHITVYKQIEYYHSLEEAIRDII